MSDINAVELIHISKQFKGGQSADVQAVNDVNISIRNGEFFSLLGPSGCGKSTTLRMIAGFEIPSSGELKIMGESMGDTPPHLRPVNMVFQNYALFPHMTIFDNVGFGLKMDGVDKAEIKTRVEEALKMVQLEHVARRKPKQLSGGQQQRIALARALVKRPVLLLLDEPLGALDRKLRKTMQLELKHMQQTLGITFIYVTHDQEEAITMSDRIAVMHNGRVLQVGAPVEIYEEPNCSFVADFIGESNFIPATVKSLDRNVILVEIGRGMPLYLPNPEFSLRQGQEVTLCIRPEKGVLFSQPAQDSRYCFIPGTVQEELFLGEDISHTVLLSENLQVVIRSQNIEHFTSGKFKPGNPVYIRWALNHLRILKEES
jgi:spermidine/putrescine transport system ATP-binding protein